MGRALLIITLGSFIVLGIIQQAVNNRQITMTEGNIENFMVSHGRNVTGSALEMAVTRIIQDSDWESEPRPWNYPLNDMDVDVFVDTNDDFPTEVDPGFLRVRSELQLENRTIRSFAFLRQGSMELPDMEAALAVYGKNSTVDIRGQPLKVVGNDTNPDGTPGPEDPLPGIAARITESELVSATGPPHQDPVQYEGDPDYLHNPDMDDTKLKELLEQYQDIGVPYVSGNSIGTPESPAITIIDQPGARFTGGERGAGIMIVNKDADVFFGGNFHFEGIIFIQGSMMTTGTVNIFGGAIMTDNAVVEEDSDLYVDPDDPDISLRGTPTIYYSSQVLGNIQDRLGGGGSNTFVDRISY